MKKKRLTKQEKIFIEKLRDQQVRTLMSLKSALKLASDKTDELKSKIESSGIDTNYSSSSDLLEIAERVYRFELRLSELKQIESDVIYGWLEKSKDK